MKKVIIFVIICILSLVIYGVYSNYKGKKIAEESLRKYGTSSEEIERMAKRVDALKKRSDDIANWYK